MKTAIFSLLCFAVCGFVYGVSIRQPVRVQNKAQEVAVVDVGSPIAWYKMTATGTNATQILDFAGSYHASNKPSVATGPTLITTNGQYYQFDGSEDYFDSSMIATNSKIAFSLWINMQSASTKYFMGRSDPSDVSFRMWYESSDDTLRIRIAKSDKSEVEANLPTQPTAPACYFKWMYLCIIADGTTLSVYTNGALSATNIYDGTLYAGNAGSVFSIGGYPVGSSYWNGCIDDVRIFTNLTPVQVTNIYQAGRQ